MSEGSPTEDFGPYIVYEQLGIGGMAQVHRAVAAKDAFQRSVALKRMLSHIAGSEDMVKSFVREARLASYLRHENVAQTYDLGRVDDTYFIVMELVTGRNLREVLRHCGVTTGPMPVQFALNILNQVCDALDYAHNLCDDAGQPLGIIHRDVSPSNVIVSETGVVKLIDFGIAKASGGGLQTMSGTLKGKFAYMAPEYIAGRIDARADLFAVGVIAHELLTNRPLFAGRDDIDTLSRVRDMQIAPPSKRNPLVPPEIDDIVMTALARDPERRWQHATALRTALTTLTRRLGLIASNAQVVQWLDWAFSQPPKQAGRRANEHDTDEDDEPDTAEETADRASLAVDQHTVEQRTLKQRAFERRLLEQTSPSQSSLSQKVTLLLGDGDPTPPSKPPIGTQESLPAQKSSPPTSNADPAPSAPPDGYRRHAALAPRSIADAAVAPVARSSSSFPVRGPSSSASPPLASRTRAASAPPPGPASGGQSHQVAPDPVAQSQPAATGKPAAEAGVAPPAKTLPSLGATPPFPASRARSPSAPPPQSFQAALQNLSAAAAPAAQGLQAAPSSAPQAFRASPSSPPEAFHASPSSPAQAFRASPSSPPQAVPASPSSPAPFNAALASPSKGFHASAPSAPQSFRAPAAPAAVQGFAAPQVPASPSLKAAGIAIPVLNAALVAALRPSAPAIAPAASSDPVKSQAIQRDFAPRGPAPSPPLPAARPTSPVIVAILVVLAAAAAAITVYFVLPLLT